MIWIYKNQKKKSRNKYTYTMVVNVVNRVKEFLYIITIINII